MTGEEQETKRQNCKRLHMETCRRINQILCRIRTRHLRLIIQVKMHFTCIEFKRTITIHIHGLLKGKGLNLIECRMVCRKLMETVSISLTTDVLEPK